MLKSFDSKRTLNLKILKPFNQIFRYSKNTLQSKFFKNPTIKLKNSKLKTFQITSKNLKPKKYVGIKIFKNHK